MQVPQPCASQRDDDQRSTSISHSHLWLVSGQLAPPATYYTRWGKRAIDLALAVPLLLITLVPICVIALAIRLDSPGGSLFLQRRVGMRGREFTIYKFRTMISSDDLVLLPDENGVLRHKVRNDPRVTVVGRLLRKTSLDELPQLINVVRGDMSLIGPRPELPQIVANYQPWQHARHSVKPGITGWWQVSGRGDRPMHEHTELDIQYIERISPSLDATILVKTVRVVLRGAGAF